MLLLEETPTSHAHCLGQTCANLYTLFRKEGTKPLPCSAAHPRIGHIREYPPPCGGPYLGTVVI